MLLEQIVVVAERLGAGGVSAVDEEEHPAAAFSSCRRRPRGARR
jgi:hypothetical protein